MRKIALSIVVCLAASSAAFAADYPGNQTVSKPRPTSGQIVLRIEADITSRTRRWTGTTSCSRPKRASDAVAAALPGWVAAKQKEHPGSILLSSGYSKGKFASNTWRDYPTAGRECAGRVLTAPAYVEFQL